MSSVTLTVFTQTFFRILPLMWQSRLVLSIHIASKRPFPSMRNTCAYSAKTKMVVYQKILKEDDPL